MINKHLLLHDSFKKALGLVYYCYSNRGSTLLLTGESGVGKTTIIQESLKRLEKNDTAPTILSVHVPVPFNLRVFLSSLLKGIGVPQYDKGTSEQKKERLIETMKGTGVRLMLIDDFQHILLGRREAIEVIGVLKEIINSTGVSLVAVATPEIYTLKDSLQEIIQIKLDLNHLNYQSAEDVAVFKSILDEIEQHFKFQKPSNIRDFSDEIFILTNGNFAKIFTLIQRAIFLAELNKEPKLSLQSLYYSSREMFGSPKKNHLYQRVLEEERKGTLSKLK